MKSKIIAFLLNPYFVASIITIVVYFMVSDSFSKYKIEQVSRDAFYLDVMNVFFNDLDNDQQNEKIISFYNSSDNVAFEVHTPKNELLDQWNFNGKFTHDASDLYFSDIDNNGFDEVIFVTMRQDSIFLNIIEPLKEKGIDRRDIYIDYLLLYNDNYDTFVSSFNFVQDDSGQKEIFFNVNSGFLGYPRSVFKYNFKDDRLYKSPHLTNFQNIETISNFKGTTDDFIFLNSWAPGNTIDTIYTKRSDKKTWLTVLKEDLSFAFEPIAFEYPYFQTFTHPYTISGNPYFVCVVNSRMDDSNSDLLRLYTMDGKVYKDINLPTGHYPQITINEDNNIVLPKRGSNEVVIYDSNLNKVQSTELKQDYTTFRLDLDGDGNTEWINVSKNFKNISIYTHNFKYPANYEIDSEFLGSFKYGIKQRNVDNTVLYISYDNEYFILKYEKNKYFYLNYLFLLAFYLGVLLVFNLILRGQRYRLEKQAAIERRIAELQLKTIKNQVDPHFVFNAMNTISAMTLEDDKLAVDDFICKFSDLMRLTLKGSDSIAYSMKEEIDYVENYIQLQQIRFNKSFEYQIIYSKSIDLNTQVPKHVLYSYVENAIKHGLTKMKQGGVLKINIKRKQNSYLLIIENNGGGLEDFSSQKRNSTGNGIKIMASIYELYKKLYNKKIEHKISELKDKHGNPVGVRVEIIIPI